MIANALAASSSAPFQSSALDGNQAPLSQDHRDERHDAGTGGLVLGASEPQVGLVEVTLEQVGGPYRVKHGRPVRGSAD